MYDVQLHVRGALNVLSALFRQLATSPDHGRWCRLIPFVASAAASHDAAV